MRRSITNDEKGLWELFCSAEESEKKVLVPLIIWNIGAWETIQLGVVMMAGTWEAPPIQISWMGLAQTALSDPVSIFFSLMTGICYRILENPTINHQKHRPTREAVIHLLAVTLMRYDHMLSEFSVFFLTLLRFLLKQCPTYILWPFFLSSDLAGATLKITQMLQHFEHVAPLFGGAVSLWATEYGMKSIVGELLR